MEIMCFFALPGGFLSACYTVKALIVSPFLAVLGQEIRLLDVRLLYKYMYIMQEASEGSFMQRNWKLDQVGSMCI